MGDPAPVHRCMDAGAAIVHAHNTDYQLTGPAAAGDSGEATWCVKPSPWPRKWGDL